jgi:hypothetical protein
MTFRTRRRSAGLAGLGAHAVAGRPGDTGQLGRSQQLAGLALEAVQGDERHDADEEHADGGGLLACRGGDEQQRQRDGEGDEVELVGASEQVRQPGEGERRQSERPRRRAADGGVHRPQRRPRDEDERQPELEQLVRIGADARRVERERQALEVLDAEEAEGLVDGLPRRGDQERQPAGQRRARRDRQRPRRAEQRHPERRRGADLQAEHCGEAGQDAGEHQAPRGGEQRAQTERERRRVRAGPGRERHRARHGDPGEEGEALGARLAPREPVGQQRDHGVEDDPEDPPGHERRPEERVERREEERLAGRVVPPEVAVGQLAVGDPARGLQHEALVVRADLAPDRRGRQERRQHEQDGVAAAERPAAHSGASGWPPARAPRHDRAGTATAIGTTAVLRRARRARSAPGSIGAAASTPPTCSRSRRSRAACHAHATCR